MKRRNTAPFSLRSFPNDDLATPAKSRSPDPLMDHQLDCCWLSVLSYRSIGFPLSPNVGVEPLARVSSGMKENRL